jgi:hypothetical protein
MGLFLRFFVRPSPRGRGADVADDSLAAGMYVDVFHHNFLLTLAAVPVEKVSEPLFSALMKQLGGIEPKTKCEGLRKFQSRGWVLVDATYEPVNERDNSGRDRVIDRDFHELCGDLKQLLARCWSEIPLILIKANVAEVEGRWVQRAQQVPDGLLSQQWTPA